MQLKNNIEKHIIQLLTGEFMIHPSERNRDLHVNVMYNVKPEPKYFEQTIKILSKEKSKIKPIIIAISGKAGSGKDTLLGFFKKKLKGKVEEFSHSYPLKQMLLRTLKFEAKQLYNQDHKHDINDMWGISGRTAMIFFGTALFRNRFRKDVWIKLLNYSIEHSNSDYILIQDCRFEDEAVNIKKMGGYIINICRDPYYFTKRYKLMAKFFKHNQWLFWILYKLKLISFRWNESEVHNIHQYADISIMNLGTLQELDSKVNSHIQYITEQEARIYKGN